MMNHLPENPTAHDHSASASGQGIAVSGTGNIVIKDVQGNVTVILDGRDVRSGDIVGDGHYSGTSGERNDRRAENSS